MMGRGRYNFPMMGRGIFFANFVVQYMALGKKVGAKIIKALV